MSESQEIILRLFAFSIDDLLEVECIDSEDSEITFKFKYKSKSKENENE